MKCGIDIKNFETGLCRRQHTLDKKGIWIILRLMQIRWRNIKKKAAM